jgi:hypothetical protein
MQDKVNEQGILVPEIFPLGLKKNLFPAPRYLALGGITFETQGTVGVFGHYHDAALGGTNGTAVDLGLILKIKKAYGKIMQGADIRYGKTNAKAFIAAEKIMPLLKALGGIVNLFPVVAQQRFSGPPALGKAAVGEQKVLGFNYFMLHGMFSFICKAEAGLKAPTGAGTSFIIIIPKMGAVNFFLDSRRPRAFTAAPYRYLLP